MKLQKLFYVILYFKRFNFSLLKLNNLLKKRENDHQEHLLNLRKFSLIVHTFSTTYASQFLHEKHKKEKKNNSLTWQVSYILFVADNYQLLLIYTATHVSYRDESE